ncbi:MAG: hypothetical protein QOG65_3140 [Actinomycetota bacterium]|nr:hypothetical protein [Actinomycetota bacterium]
MREPPPLSIVIPTREGIDELAPVLAALEAQVERTGAEVIVVGPAEQSATPAWLRVVTMRDEDIYSLRTVGLREARGAVVAIGEDHAVPRDDWSESIVRAHAEHPATPAVVGCMYNGTAATLAGRSNFLAFAAPFEAPMPTLRARRPPPSSIVSLKASALEAAREEAGYLEATLIPRLFEEGRIAADDRIVIDHYQDNGMRWSIVNAFHSARASYGAARAGLDRSQRLYTARWSLVNWPRRILSEARAATGSRIDLAAVAAIAAAAALGAASGSLAGPGRSSARVA